MKVATVVLFFFCIGLTAQVRNPEIPLRNWPAPLYWHPSQAESEKPVPTAPTESRTLLPRAASPDGSLVFVAMTPCRLVDTRVNQMFPVPFGPPGLGSGPARSFPIQSSAFCSIPLNAQAYSFNVTVIPPGPLGYLILWPTGQMQPNAVTLDDITGDIRNNAAIVPAGTPNGSISAVVNANTDLVIDINGYYAPSTGISLAQGTSGAPSVSFSGDTGTGIFSSGPATLNFTTGGTNRLTVRPDGDLDLVGSIRKSGTLFLHVLGTGNLGLGLSALAANSGSFNTAHGSAALGTNTMGNFNTATGYATLGSNTTGSFNSGAGYAALFNNTTGNGSTATGYGALGANTTGSNNTADGYLALSSNTTGFNNTASGVYALHANTTGVQNTASGLYALYDNTTGAGNTASGFQALWENATGGSNTALGFETLFTNTTGNLNIALGYQAGYQIALNNNIDIGNPGVYNDSDTIRIGTGGADINPPHTRLFLAAVRGVTPSAGDGVNVLIDSNGQLGAPISSRRFKEDIQDMDGASSGLLRLRPVTFRYRKPYTDGSKPLDYGLIAEEVAEVYPDLVVKGADGQIETVQYQKLTPMLLNEVQKEHDQLKKQNETFRSLQAQVAALQKTVESLMSGKLKSTTRKIR